MLPLQDRIASIDDGADRTKVDPEKVDPSEQPRLDVARLQARDRLLVDAVDPGSEYLVDRLDDRTIKTDAR